MPSKIYRPRIADKILSERLRSVGAVLIQGPKWCGKTTTAAQIAGSVLSLDDLGNGMKYRQMPKLSPALLLEGATPRLLDEWQLAPTLWDSVRRAVDDRGGTGTVYPHKERCLS